MAQFNINAYNKDKYREVTLQEGLDLLEDGQADKLYSDGLEFDEYIKFVKNYFTYEDNCYLGQDIFEMKERIQSDWMDHHKFYVSVNTLPDEPRKDKAYVTEALMNCGRHNDDNKKCENCYYHQFAKKEPGYIGTNCETELLFDAAIHLRTDIRSDNRKRRRIAMQQHIANQYVGRL